MSETSVWRKWEGTIDTFFFSPFLEDLNCFGLSSCKPPYSFPFWVVPLLECTSSTNAARKKKFNKFKQTETRPLLKGNNIRSSWTFITQKSIWTCAILLHCTSRQSCQGLSYLTLSMRGNLRLYGAEKTWKKKGSSKNEDEDQVDQVIENQWNHQNRLFLPPISKK